MLEFKYSVMMKMVTWTEETSQNSKFKRRVNWDRRYFYRIRSRYLHLCRSCWNLMKCLRLEGKFQVWKQDWFSAKFWSVIMFFFFTWVFLLALRKPAWPEKTSRLWNRHRRADKRRHTWKDKTSLMLPPLLSSSPSLLFFFNRSAVHFSPFNANRHFESFKLFSISFLLPSILGVYLKHLTSLLLLQLLLQKMGKKHCFLLFRPNFKKP